MSGFVRSSDRCRLTVPQHVAVLALVRWYLADPRAADDVEIDRLIKVEVRMGRQPVMRGRGSFIRQSDRCRLSLRQHKTLVMLLRWYLATYATWTVPTIDLERIKAAAPKLEEVLRATLQHARSDRKPKSKRARGGTDSYWQKRINAAMFLKRQKSGNTIWMERLA